MELDYNMVKLKCNYFKHMEQNWIKNVINFSHFYILFYKKCHEWTYGW